VNRDELREGAADLGVDFDEHLAVVINALADRGEELMSVDGEAGTAPG
jgi:predicted hydrolase (HD superfamily)